MTKILGTVGEVFSFFLFNFFGSNGAILVDFGRRMGRFWIIFSKYFWNSIILPNFH